MNSAQTLLAAEEPNYLNTLRAKYYSVSVTARAFSQTEREWMNEHTTLRVGYLENYLPYSDTNDKMKSSIPIVAVTANAFKEDRQIAMDAGMNGHLAKPYDVPAIMKTLKELIG